MSEKPAKALPSSKIPGAAKWLGGMGALPFVFLAAAIHEVGGLYNPIAPSAILAYGAIILSFLGGAQWGLSIAVRNNAGSTAERLTTSILPSLVGWAALFMPLDQGLLVLAGAFAVVLAIDLLWHRKGRSPDWYPRLRVALTSVVIASLLIARFGL